MKRRRFDGSGLPGALRGLTSGRSPWRQFGAGLFVEADRSKPEGVFSLGNQGQDGVSIQLCVHVAGFQPRAQPGVEDLGLPIPKTGVQSALNLEMIQHQLDARDVSWKIAPDIVRAHMKSRDSASLLCVLTTMHTCHSMLDEASLGDRGQGKPVTDA